MSTFGQTLRQAREAKGLTTSQVAQETHILVQIIEAMENEDFHRIPAAIYGRGFVKAYAACVDLDPQPLIREFMDIYEGRRAPTVQVRNVPQSAAPTPQPAVPAAPEPVAPPPMPDPVAAAPEPAPLWDPPAPAAAPEPVAAAPEPAPLWDPPAPLQTPDPEPSPVPPVSEPVAEPPVSEPAVEPPAPEPPVVPAPVPPAPEPAPLWDPPVPAPEPDAQAVEPPPVVRGLDLFEQAATAQVPPRATESLFPEPPDERPLFQQPEPAAPATPEPVPAAQTRADGFGESAFLPPSYEDNGPSAAERFRTGLSTVSKGVLKSVRGIPRSAWRIALLALAALGVVALLVFGCVKLYQATATIPKDPCANGACEFDPGAAAPAANPAANPAAEPARSQPDAKAPAKPAASTKAPAKPAAAAVPAKAAPKGPVKLRSTGPKVPALYAD